MSGYLRFQQRVRIVPGVHLNFSKRRVSLSVSSPGATWNMGPRGQRTTIGIPGSGLSYVEQERWAKPSPAAPPKCWHPWRWLFWSLVIGGPILLGDIRPSRDDHLLNLVPGLPRPSGG
jgi:hypothetical protein